MFKERRETTKMMFMSWLVILRKKKAYGGGGGMCINQKSRLFVPRSIGFYDTQQNIFNGYIFLKVFVFSEKSLTFFLIIFS